MSDFKIHSICVVKNEADIIEYCIREALNWSDYIYIYDGESSDNTWQIANRMKSDRVIPWKQDGKVFQESLRAEVFNAFKHTANPGDWWCHLDADEFYIQDPKRFLSEIKPPHHVVWGISVEYYITHDDLRTIDFSQSIESVLPQLKYYRAAHSEPRFFRHRDRLRWSPDRGWPHHMGLSHPERIQFRHFKYRSPDQIQRRLDTRRHNVERGFTGWKHARNDSWREKIADADQCHLDNGDGRFAIEPTIEDHLGSKKSRFAKWLMHTAGIWP